MTKLQLADLVLLRIYRGQTPADADLNVDDVMPHITQARDWIVTRDLWQRMKDDEEGFALDSSFQTPFKNVEVKYDSDLDQYYVDLPAMYADLPRGLGVPFMAPMQSWEKPFYRLTTGSSLSSFEGEVFYELEGQKAYLRGFKFSEYQKAWQTLKLYMRIVTVGNDNEDDLFMPSYLEDEVIRRVLEIMGYSDFEDKTNDGRDQK